MTDILYDRRAILTAATIAGAGSISLASAQQSAAAHMAQMMAPPGPDAPRIGMLVYPKMIALDLINPMTVFNILRCRIDLVWKDLTPVPTDVGLAIAPNRTFADCPLDLDVLFVPGGLMGSLDCMNDPAVNGFLASRGTRAKWVTSICTGGLMLGAAGLLKGYDATAHWGVVDLLPLLGAKHVDKRVVVDRNRVTGGGATAGLDFALSLAARMFGEEEARRVQLILEYAPEPPFRNGTPADAGPERTAAARSKRIWMDQQARLAAEKAGKRLGIDLP